MTDQNGAAIDHDTDDRQTRAMTAASAAREREQAQRSAMKQQWRCDVCRLVSFPTFEEACQHEEECRRRHDEMAVKAVAKPKPAAKTKAPVTKPVNAFFAARKPNPKATAPAKPPEVVELSDSGPRTAKKRPSRAPIVDLLDDTPKTATAAKRSKKTKPETPSLASIFAATGADRETLLAEQAALEFRAKRLQREQEQREKQRRKQQAFRPAAASASTSKPAPKVTKSAAPRFPTPSHVIPAVSSSLPMLPTAVGEWLQPADLIQARSALVSSSSPVVDLTDDNEAIYMPLLAPSGSRFATPWTTHDPLLTLLHNLVLPPPTPWHSKDHRLWVDKYTIASVPEDVIGDARRQVASSMMAFVKWWMMERQKANARMKERQAQLQQHKATKTKKRRKVVKNDDDLWSDADDDESRLHSLCLVTGPSGSGKTSLVHAVAAACGSEVLEINTGDKRGRGTAQDD